MSYHKPRRNRFRNNGKTFRRNGSENLRIGGDNLSLNNPQRQSFFRNNNNAEQLLEKYNDLAKEALTNGDRILSESYYQHADHFLRVIENRNSVQNNLKSDLDDSSIKKNFKDKIILENEKNSSS